MKKLEKKLKQHYYEKETTFIISYFTSIVGGFVAGVVLAVALGNSPLEIYRRLGSPILIWGIISSLMVIFFGLILWFFLIWLPRRKDLNSLKDTNNIMEKEKINLEKFLKNHEGTLLALSIFMLITLEVVSSKTYLWQVFGVLSSLLSYSLMISLISGLKNDETRWVFWFKVYLSIFITVFCIWAMLNIIPWLIGDFIIISWIVLGLIGMILPSIKLFFR